MIVVNNDYIEIIDKFTKILESLEGFIDITSEDRKVSLEDVFFDDLLCFLLYLSCCDGYLSFEEAEFLEKYTGFYMTPQQMHQRVVKDDLFSEVFEEKIPESLKMFVDLQNGLTGMGKGADNALIDTYMTIFKHLGRAITDVDGDMQPEEAYGLTHYMHKIEAYIAENLDDYEKKNCVEYKNKNGISGGIIAPEKKLR